MSEEFTLIAYVRSSKFRGEILKCLVKGAGTPKEIWQEIGGNRNYTSRLLSGLEKRGLVKNMSPSIPTHPLYTITERGRDILIKVHKLSKRG